MDKYSRELHKVTICLLRFMSRNLGLHSEALTSVFEDGRQGIKTNFYPPCVQANKVVGISPHSDATGLTLLLQVSNVRGLQIKKYGKWVTVQPIPNAFIVNIGDVIEVRYLCLCSIPSVFTKFFAPSDETNFKHMHSVTILPAVAKKLPHHMT